MNLVFQAADTLQTFLREQQWRFCFIGGLAVQHWGEPRVTGMLVVFLIALVYRILRSSVDEAGRRARFSAVFAIMGAIVAIFAYAAIHIWNTTHPRVISPRGIGLQEDMKRAFFLCIGSTFFVTLALVQTRYRLARLEHDLERLEHEADEALDHPEPA